MKSFMCFHCGEAIVPEGDYIGIFRKTQKGSMLYLHESCFKAVAGQGYIMALAVDFKNCKICGKEINGERREVLICHDCLIDHAPTCKKCGHIMLPRVNKSDNSIFWGCSRYPVCQRTASFHK
jgi:hypothetical protein